MDNESWIRLSILYPLPDDEHFERYLFEQEICATLYAYGAATINEQDPTTLDGKDLPRYESAPMLFQRRSSCRGLGSSFCRRTTRSTKRHLDDDANRNVFG